MHFPNTPQGIKELVNGLLNDTHNRKEKWFDVNNTQELRVEIDNNFLNHYHQNSNSKQTTYNDILRRHVVLMEKNKKEKKSKKGIYLISNLQGFSFNSTFLVIMKAININS